MPWGHRFLWSKYYTPCCNFHKLLHIVSSTQLSRLQILLFGQIQASIAQTFRRQTEALGRKRTTAKATAAAFMRRSQGSYRRRRNRAAELEISDDDGDANGNDGGKDSSSADEHCTEVKPKRSKRWGGARFSQPSSAAGIAERGGDENDSELNREAMGASVALVGNSERLAWGKGGMRSYTRYGTVGGGSGKNARNSRLSKLVNCLRNLEESEDEVMLEYVFWVMILYT